DDVGERGAHVAVDRGRRVQRQHQAHVGVVSRVQVDLLRAGRAQVDVYGGGELREVERVVDRAGRRVHGDVAELTAGELEDGAAAAGDERVVTGAGDQRGGAAAADERVVARAARQQVGRGVALDDVVARRADDVL